MKHLLPIFHWLFLLGIPFQLSAQKGEHQVPKLVVGIHIDQLQEEYLQWFNESFGQGGFKQLMEDGCVFSHVRYLLPAYDTDAANVSAALLSGCPPYDNGITAIERFDKTLGKRVSCIYDPNYIGNYTESCVSPTALKTGSLGDELKVATKGYAKVFAISPEPEAGIVSAGHKANAVYWIDDKNGKWCTSTYYNYMPRWLENLNDFGGIESRAKESKWTAKYPFGQYTRMPYKSGPALFQYAVMGNGSPSIASFKQTPMLNTEVCRLANELIQHEHLGQDEYPDLLLLHFRANSRLVDAEDRASFELQDFYYRLDEDLADLLQAIDKQIGLKQVLIYLSGTGEVRYPAIEEKKEKEHLRYFYPERCAALLNLYLNAVYGNQNWVLGHTEHEIFLNREEIDKQHINYSDFCKEACYFLTEMDGINRVIATQDYVIGGGHFTQEDQNAFHKGRSGDIHFRIENNRNICWDNYPHYNRQLRYIDRETIFIIYGAGIQAESRSEEVSIFDLAPSLSKLLYIRPPTACIGKALF